MTIGGGVILDPQAEKFKLAEVSARQAFLENRKSLELPDLVLSEMAKKRQVMADSILAASPFPKTRIDQTVQDLIKQKRLATTGQFLIDIAFWQDASGKILAMAQVEHKVNRLKKGLSQAAAQSALGLEKDIFDALVQELVSAGKLVRLDDALALPEHRQQLSSQQEAQAAAIRLMFQRSPTAPPTLKEITAEIPGSAGIVKYLAQQGELVELPEGVLMGTAQFTAVEVDVVRLLKEKGQVTIQDMNARFGFSRKFSIPLLAHLDRLGITRREGDVRVAGKKTAE
jgi:selenocysteine-specific elongation factor